MNSRKKPPFPTVFIGEKQILLELNGVKVRIESDWPLITVPLDGPKPDFVTLSKKRKK